MAVILLSSPQIICMGGLKKLQGTKLRTKG
jgi:hypothetical protein